MLIGDKPESTAHPRIMTARDGHPAWSPLKTELDASFALEPSVPLAEFRARLGRLVPELNTGGQAG